MLIILYYIALSDCSNLSVLVANEILKLYFIIQFLTYNINIICK